MREVDTGKRINPLPSELNRPCLAQSLDYWISLSPSLPSKVDRISLTALLATLEGIPLIATSLSLYVIVTCLLLNHLEFQAKFIYADEDEKSERRIYRVR